MPNAFALVRPPSRAYVEALGQHEGAAPIDLPLALAQHAAYTSALTALGCEPLVLPAEDALPDACFVEDTAVIVGDLALITRPGAPSRRPETSAVAAALAAAGLELAHMEDPATLDGGDVLRLGDTFYVGLSRRTNAAGLAALEAVARPRGLSVVPVEVPGGVLHLKCHASPLGPETLLCAPGWLTGARGVRRLEVHPEEAYAANALAVGDAVLVAAGFPRTAALISDAGFSPVPIENSEFAKADGSLTCLSVIARSPRRP